MDGFAAPTGQLMPTGASGYEASLKPDPYDPAAAKKLLAEAGFPNGFGLTLHGPKPLRQRQPDPGGHRADVDTYWRQDFGGCHAGGDVLQPCAAHEFSIRLTGWASDTGDASSNLTELIASSNPDKGRRAIVDPGRYANAKVDEIVERSLTTVDAGAREALYREAEKMAMPDYPIIPLHHQVNIWGVRNGIVFHTRMQEGIRAWDVTQE
jgi:peptide/nickel transport system substrate-binding protein